MQVTKAVRHLARILLLCALICLTAVPKVLASSATMTASGHPAVVDQAGLFTDEEREALAEEAARLSQQYQADVVIVTTNDAEGKESMAYADDYFDYNGYGVGEDHSGILMLLDMDHRNVWISTTGHAIDVFTDYRIERTLDEVFEYMPAGDYAGASRAFLREAEDYFEAGVPEGQFREKMRVRSLKPFHFVGGGLAGLAVALIFYRSKNKQYKKQPQSWNYDLKTMTVPTFTVFTDELVNRYVTSRRAPRETSSSSGGSGRSTTHTSSSGRTHGGGGRSF